MDKCLQESVHFVRLIVIRVVRGAFYDMERISFFFVPPLVVRSYLSGSILVSHRQADGAGDAEVLDFRDEACEAQVHEAAQFFFVIRPEHPQHILSARQRDAAHFYDGGAQQAVGETFEHPFCLHQPEQVGAAVIIRAVGAGAYSKQARYQRGIPGDKGLRHKAPGGLAYKDDLLDSLRI